MGNQSASSWPRPSALARASTGAVLPTCPNRRRSGALSRRYHLRHIRSRRGMSIDIEARKSTLEPGSPHITSGSSDVHWTAKRRLAPRHLIGDGDLHRFYLIACVARGFSRRGFDIWRDTEGFLVGRPSPDR